MACPLSYVLYRAIREAAVSASFMVADRLNDTTNGGLSCAVHGDIWCMLSALCIDA